LLQQWAQSAIGETNQLATRVSGPLRGLMSWIKASDTDYVEGSAAR
jgi:hypothetical protein